MSNATEYADSLVADIEANDAIGVPFGLVSDDNPVSDRENGDEVSALDWLGDVLDIKYLVDSDASYLAARICIAYGGPTAWIDTRTGNLEVSWWSEPVIRPLPSAFISGLDEALGELWDMR